MRHLSLISKLRRHKNMFSFVKMMVEIQIQVQITIP